MIRKNAPDLGAPLTGKVLRSRELRPAGPGQTGMDRAAREYPMVSEDEWFAWLRDRA